MHFDPAFSFFNIGQIYVLSHLKNRPSSNRPKRRYIKKLPENLRISFYIKNNVIYLTKYLEVN